VTSREWRGLRCAVARTQRVGCAVRAAKGGLRGHSAEGSPSALVSSTAVEGSLDTQQSQRPLELALNQPRLVSNELPEVTLTQLPGTSIELGASRRDQRRRSSAMSAASSVARHYRPLDDDMEVAQDGL
jgi:hypothetical protein